MGLGWSSFYIIDFVELSKKVFSTTGICLLLHWIEQPTLPILTLLLLLLILLLTTNGVSSSSSASPSYSTSAVISGSFARHHGKQQQQLLPSSTIGLLGGISPSVLTSWLPPVPRALRRWSSSPPIHSSPRGRTSSLKNGKKAKLSRDILSSSVSRQEWAGTLIVIKNLVWNIKKVKVATWHT